MRPLYSHVDLRVRDRERAVAFYDPIMQALGFQLASRVPGDEWPTDEWPTWVRPGGRRNDEFFDFEVDADHTPNENRVAFCCDSKAQVDAVVAVTFRCGAREPDGPLEYSDRKVRRPARRN